MKPILAALLLLTLIPLARAADDANSSHYKMAEQTLTLLDTSNLLKQGIDQMVKVQMQQNPAMAPYEGVMKDFLNKYMSWESLKPDLIKLYVEEFTEAELGELNKFYQSPIGKKVVQKMPALMGKGAQIGTQRVQEHMAELQAAVEEQEKKQSAETKPAPEAKPSAAPKK